MVIVMIVVIVVIVMIVVIVVIVMIVMIVVTVAFGSVVLRLYLPLYDIASIQSPGRS